MSNEESTIAIGSGGLNGRVVSRYNWELIDERIDQRFKQHTDSSITPYISHLDGRVIEMEEALNVNLRAIGDTFKRLEGKVKDSENDVRKLRYALYGTMTLLAGLVIFTGQLVIKTGTL